MSNLDKKVTVRLNKNEWKEFKDMSEKYNMSRSQLIRQFIESFNNGRLEITDLFESS